MGFSWEPLFLSAKLAFVTTTLLGVTGVFIIYLIHFYSFGFKPMLKALVSLPLVLPPSVLGFYLLVAFQPDTFVGGFFDNLFGLRLIFSFPGLVLASMIFSMPFMINPILSALENLPKTYQEASFTLGKSKLITYRKVLLPLIKPSIVVAAIMTFAHTIGEFGVILMIGGNIPRETRVASIAIYNEVEGLNYGAANQYAFILLLFSFVMLTLVYYYQARNFNQTISA